jgi:hypothetical protein
MKKLTILIVVRNQVSSNVSRWPEQRIDDLAPGRCVNRTW